MSDDEGKGKVVSIAPFLKPRGPSGDATRDLADALTKVVATAAPTMKPEEQIAAILLTLKTVGVILENTFGEVVAEQIREKGRVIHERYVMTTKIHGLKETVYGPVNDEDEKK